MKKIACIVAVAVFVFSFIIFASFAIHFKLGKRGFVDYYIPKMELFVRITLEDGLLYYGLSKSSDNLDYVGKCPEDIDYFVTRAGHYGSGNIYFNLDSCDTLNMDYIRDYHSVHIPMREAYSTWDYRYHSGDLRPGIGCLWPYYYCEKVKLYCFPDTIEIIELKRRFL